MSDKTEKAKEYSKRYYQKNREIWVEKYNGQKVTCTICGSIISKCNLLRHQRTNKKCMKAKEVKEEKDVFEYILADEKNLKEFMERIADKMKSLKEKEKPVPETEA